MVETKKQRMDPERRYSFEEKGEILEHLKGIYRDHGAELREKLQNDIQEIENKIS